MIRVRKKQDKAIDLYINISMGGCDAHMIDSSFVDGWYIAKRKIADVKQISGILYI